MKQWLLDGEPVTTEYLVECVEGAGAWAETIDHAVTTLRENGFDVVKLSDDQVKAISMFEALGFNCDSMKDILGE